MRTKTFFKRTWQELSGAIHIHTACSHDCDVPLATVIEAAKRRRLDYIMITDHNNYDGRSEYDPSSSGELTVIIGIEVEDPKQNNHYLVFGSDSIHTRIPVREYLERYAAEDAVGFMAHPREVRLTGRYRKYEWTEDNVPEATGLEVWNYLSIWLGHLHESLNGVLLLLVPGWFVRKPLRRSMRLWDQLNLAGQRKVGIGSVDAHGHRYNLRGWRFRVLPHRYMFRTLRTNVLLPAGVEPGESAILSALRAGHCYVVNYLLGDPYEFYAGICSESGNGVTFGEEISFESGLRFYFRLPKPAEVRLYGNGTKLSRQNATTGWFPIDEPGFYRLEINRFRYGWIYTNPIYVIDVERKSNG